MDQTTKPKKHKRLLTKVTNGKVFVHSTFNNTIITITDEKGKVLCWSSPGVIGYKGSKKSTPFAASIAAKDAVKKARVYGLRDVQVFLRGPGAGKDSAVRSLRSEGLNLQGVTDLTPTPHNGCRPKKRRRV